MPREGVGPGARSGGGLDAEVACGRPMGVRRRGAVCGAAGGEAFYEHYRIGGAGEPATAEDEPRKEGELTTEYVGSHSPFGIVWQIADATGWGVDYIMWKVNYQTLRMMLADAPHYETRRRGSQRRGEKPHKPKSVSGYFQTRLQQDQ